MKRKKLLRAVAVVGGALLMIGFSALPGNALPPDDQYIGSGSGNTSGPFDLSVQIDTGTWAVAQGGDVVSCLDPITATDSPCVPHVRPRQTCSLHLKGTAAYNWTGANMGVSGKNESWTNCSAASVPTIATAVTYRQGCLAATRSDSDSDSGTPPSVVVSYFEQYYNTASARCPRYSPMHWNMQTSFYTNQGAGPPVPIDLCVAFHATQGGNITQTKC